MNYSKALFVGATAAVIGYALRKTLSSRPSGQSERGQELRHFRSEDALRLAIARGYGQQAADLAYHA